MTTITETSTAMENRSPLGRLAVMAWLAGGALWLAAGLVHDSTGWRFDTSSVLWLTADAFIALGLVALFTLRPHGSSRIGAVALGVALVARGAFAGGEIASLVQGHDDNPLIPLGALLTAVAMTAYGVVVPRRSEIRDNRRWAFLAMGLYPFVAMFPVVALTGEPATVLIALWGAPMALVGTACASLTRPTLLRAPTAPAASGASRASENESPGRR